MSNVFTEDAKRYDLHIECEDTRKEAYLYEKLENGIVRCALCPRRCTIGLDRVGFCKVRKNIGGTLYAQSYEKATHVTIEKIETEALFNYQPGAKILSLGNFGCNLDCDYCQNWVYSQFQYTPPDKIHEYSIEKVINLALTNNIEILSWTYNDPSVWFEFVVDTAKEAKKHGIKSLFKSAFFLTPEAVEELCKVIDIFAISIKAIDENYYQKFTKGWLQPVLDNAKLVYSKGIHCEISNLIVTGLTNNIESYDKMIDFVMKELSPEVPLHFTRFHPDYKYMHVEKTPTEDVMEARKRGIERGLKYVYVGNVFESGGINTYCPECGELLIERYGLCAYIKEPLNKDGKCGKCGYQTNIKEIEHADEEVFI